MRVTVKWQPGQFRAFKIWSESSKLGNIRCWRAEKWKILSSAYFRIRSKYQPSFSWNLIFRTKTSLLLLCYLRQLLRTLFYRVLGRCSCNQQNMILNKMYDLFPVFPYKQAEQWRSRAGWSVFLFTRDYFENIWLSSPCSALRQWLVGAEVVRSLNCRPVLTWFMWTK